MSDSLSRLPGTIALLALAVACLYYAVTYRFSKHGPLHTPSGPIPGGHRFAGFIDRFLAADPFRRLGFALGGVLFGFLAAAYWFAWL